MADIKIFYGTAGCGKTYKAVSDFCKAAKECDPLFPERNCFLIVPEQLTVETERKFFERESKGLIGSEVISFARLVYRILSDADCSPGTPLTPTMRSMLLVKVLSGIDDKFTYFNRISERPSGIARLSGTVSELQKYRVTPEQLENASVRTGELHPEDKLTSGKLHELSIILELFNEETKEYADVSTLALKAINVINSGRSCIEGSSLFFDSFSGFTDVELNLIKAMASHANDVSFYLFRDKNNPVFSIPNKTVDTIVEKLGGSVKCEEIRNESNENTRFEGSKMLYTLSRNYADQKPSGFAKDDIDRSVEIVSAVDFYYELDACASRINEIVSDPGSDVDYSDIAVAIPSVSENYYVIDAVFKGHGIPCFIDTRAEFSGHRIIRLVDSALNILADDRTVDNIVLMLKTGLYKKNEFTRDDVDTLENHLLKFACDKKQTFASYKRFLDSASSKFEPDSRPSYLALAADVYELFKGEGGLCEKAKTCKTVNDVLELVSEFADICGIKDASDAVDMSKGGSRDDRDYVRVRNAFIDLLNECSLAIGDVKKNGYKVLIRFTDDVLMSASASIKAASIPPSGDFVQIGDIERSGYVDKKVMMVIGCNAGAFPGNVPDSSFLGDEERDAIESVGGKTAFNSVDRAFLSQYNVYKVLTCPREKLYLSYSLTDPDGGELAPAQAISTIKKIFKHVTVKPYSPDYSLSEPSAPVSDGCLEIDPSYIDQLLEITGHFDIGATNLDAIDRCAIMYFMEKCLDLRERDTGDFGVTVSGKYVHSLFEESIKTAISEGTFRSTDIGQWRRYVADADKKFRDDPRNESSVRSIENSERGEIIAELTRESISRELKNLARLSVDDGSTPLRLELRFGMENSAIPPVTVKCGKVTVRVNGVIDRIDSKVTDSAVLLQLTDYKTKSYNIKKVQEGKALQLPIYSLALSSREAKEYLKAILKKKGIDCSDVKVDELRYYRYGDSAENEGVLHNYSGVTKKSDPDIVHDKADGSSMNENRIKERVERVIAGSFAAFDSKDIPCNNCSYKNNCKFRNREDDSTK